MNPTSAYQKISEKIALISATMKMLGWTVLGITLLGALIGVHALSAKIDEELKLHGDAIYGTGRIRIFEVKFRALLAQIELERRDGVSFQKHVQDLSEAAERGTALFSAYSNAGIVKDVTGRLAYTREVITPDGIVAGKELLAVWFPLERKIKAVAQQGDKLNPAVIADALREADQSSLKFISLSERLAREEDNYHKAKLSRLTLSRNLLGLYFAATTGLLIPLVILTGRMEKLRESETRFRKLFEDSAEAILILEDGVFVDCNRAAFAILGVTDPERIRHISPQSLSPEFQPDGRRSDEKAAEMIAYAFERGSNLFEWMHLRVDGTPFMAEVLLTPIQDKGRRRLHVVWRDITERKQAEQVRLKLLAELERSNQDLEKFAYIASHDLQEPLRMVSSYTQLLAEKYRGKLDEKADKYIFYAVDGATRMHDLIRDLLAYASVHKTESALPEIQCSELVRDALRNLSCAIESSRATVIVGELPVIRADRILMLQVFQNLIGNAVKFSNPNNPRIEISSRKEGREWFFEIRDNGIGIDPQFHERIFGIFQRLHDRKKYQGTGIGLAVVKKIVEQYDGRIWVESNLGQGACFAFSFPEK
ncbi:MAG: hypothetical protein B9S32_12790 [Verrucomicrobia bacterium Tous-C9LFEB]|nr:MAG: hypothetical protein B9S32_12790 [Verrucomicrobia bacterium Tous-C9LFEB]